MTKVKKTAKARKPAPRGKARAVSPPRAISQNAVPVPATQPPPPPKKIYAPLEIRPKLGEDINVASAKFLTGPIVSNANAIKWFGRGTMGDDISINSYVIAFTDAAKEVNSNDFTQVEAMLMGQAMALNVMFGELTCRSANNLNGGTEYRQSMETYLKMALKAQNQCRMTLETLSNIKNPPVVYAKQANIAHGPQQVNNAPAPRAHAEENQIQPNKLLEQSNEQRMDIGTQGEASGGNPPMEALAELNGAEVDGKQG